MGENNAVLQANAGSSRELLAATAAAYTAMHGKPDGTVPATFQVRPACVPCVCTCMCVGGRGGPCDCVPGTPPCFADHLPDWVEAPRVPTKPKSPRLSGKILQGTRENKILMLFPMYHSHACEGLFRLLLVGFVEGLDIRSRLPPQLLFLCFLLATLLRTTVHAHTAIRGRNTHKKTPT